MAEQDGATSDNQLGLSLLSPNGRNSSVAQQHKSLETLLAEKNKKLTDEVTRLRVRLLTKRGLLTIHPVPQIVHNDINASLNEVTEELRALKSELDEKRALVEKLESDLLLLDKHQPNGIVGRSPSELSLPHDPLAGLDIGGKSTNVSHLDRNLIHSH